MARPEIKLSNPDNPIKSAVYIDVPDKDNNDKYVYNVDGTIMGKRYIIGQGDAKDASLTVKGLVQLYNGVDSTSTTLALSASVGKELNDKITEIQNGKVTIVDGTTTEKGIVQLYDGLDSTSTTLAATANAIKQVNDKIANVSFDDATQTTSGFMSAADKTKLDGLSNVTFSQSFSGGTEIGTLTIGGVDTIIYAPEVNIASADVAGVVKVGENLNITEDGVLNAVVPVQEKISSPNLTFSTPENNVSRATEITLSGFSMSTGNITDTARVVVANVADITTGEIIGTYEKSENLSSLGANSIYFGDIAKVQKNTSYDLSVWYRGHKDIDSNISTVRIKTASELAFTEAPVVETTTSGSHVSLNVANAVLNKNDETDQDETYNSVIVTVEDALGNVVGTKTFASDGTANTIDLYFVA